MDDVIDVIISGAGPCGSLTALILARAGVRVRIFERSTFPRDKLCGDTLNPGALAALARHVDITPLRALSLPITGMLLTGPGGVAVRGAYGSGLQGQAIQRCTFDQWMLDHARAAGVLIEHGRCVLGPVIRDEHVAGVRASPVHSGDRETCLSRITIAADGRRSRLAAMLALSRPPRRPRRWAIGAYYEAVDSVGAMGEMHVRPGRYLGIAPTPGGLANVCCVTSPGHDTECWRQPDGILRSAIAGDPALASRFSRAVRVTPASVLGPMAVDVPVAGAPGLLLAGDAAGFIDPMTGDGLRFALEGAELAAGVALEVLDGRLSHLAAPAELTRRRHARFSRKWQFNRAIRRLVDYPRGVAGAAVAARLLPGLFARLIRYAGDCDLEPGGIAAPPGPALQASDRGGQFDPAAAEHAR